MARAATASAVSIVLGGSKKGSQKADDPFGAELERIINHNPGSEAAHYDKPTISKAEIKTTKDRIKALYGLK